MKIEEMQGYIDQSAQYIGVGQDNTNPLVGSAIISNHMIKRSNLNVNSAVIQQKLAEGGVLIQNRIFVGGIPSQGSEADLRKYFEEYGPVRDVKVLKDHSGVSKGYGFVTFESEDDAMKLQDNQDLLEFRGRRLNIGPAVRRSNNQNQLFPQGTVLYTNQGIPFTIQQGVAVVPGVNDAYGLASPTNATGGGVPIYIQQQPIIVQTPNGPVAYQAPPTPITPGPSPGIPMGAQMMISPEMMPCGIPSSQSISSNTSSQMGNFNGGQHDTSSASLSNNSVVTTQGGGAVSNMNGGQKLMQQQPPLIYQQHQGVQMVHSTPHQLLPPGVEYAPQLAMPVLPPQQHHSSSTPGSGMVVPQQSMVASTPTHNTSSSALPPPPLLPPATGLQHQNQVVPANAQQQHPQPPISYLSPNMYRFPQPAAFPASAQYQIVQTPNGAEYLHYTSPMPNGQGYPMYHGQQQQPQQQPQFAEMAQMAQEVPMSYEQSMYEMMLTAPPPVVALQHGQQGMVMVNGTPNQCSVEQQLQCEKNQRIQQHHQTMQAIVHQMHQSSLIKNNNNTPMPPLVQSNVVASSVQTSASSPPTMRTPLLPVPSKSIAQSRNSIIDTPKRGYRLEKSFSYDQPSRPTAAAATVSTMGASGGGSELRYQTPPATPDKDVPALLRHQQQYQQQSGGGVKRGGTHRSVAIVSPSLNRASAAASILTQPMNPPNDSPKSSLKQQERKSRRPLMLPSGVPLLGIKVSQSLPSSPASTRTVCFHGEMTEVAYSEWAKSNGQVMGVNQQMMTHQNVQQQNGQHQFAPKNNCNTTPQRKSKNSNNSPRAQLLKLGDMISLQSGDGGNNMVTPPITPN